MGALASGALATGVLAAGMLASAGCAGPVERGSPCERPEDCPPGLVCHVGQCAERTLDLSTDRGTRDAQVRRDLAPALDADLPRDRGLEAGPIDLGSDAADGASADAAENPDSGDAANLDAGDAHVGDAGDAGDAEADASTACAPNVTEDCGGPNRGVCRTGRRTCGADGVFGPCLGAVGPSAETCNGADDDCNGVVDDGFQVGEVCDGLGLCGAGSLECATPLATRCNTEPGGAVDESRAERCNDLDDDCDGRTDEAFGVGQACAGACGPGVNECTPGGLGRCSTDPGGSSGAGGAEVCNGRDDDCDGRIDEGFGLGGACVGTGACGAGLLECNGAGTTRCSTNPGGSADRSRPERCDGRDDDCDGATDEGFALGAGCVAIGACGAGVNECAGDGTARCSSAPGGSASGSRVEACDGADNDCDGATDEGFGVGNACAARGQCAAGRLECAPAGTRCDTHPGGSRDQSRAETCNELDDDCDGRVDEDLNAGEICGGEGCGPGSPLLTLTAGRTGNTAGLENLHGGSNCVRETGGPDQVLRFSVAAAGQHVVGVAPLAPAFDPVFWIARDCAQLGNCIAGGGSGAVAPGRPKVVNVNLGNLGDHFLVVDTRGAGGPYAVSARPFVDGESCGNAVRLDLTGPEGVDRHVGTLVGRANDHAADACPVGHITTGVDQALRFDLAGPASVRVRVLPGAGLRPLVSVVRGNNCANINANCAGSAAAAAVGTEVDLVVALEAGTHYVLVESSTGSGAPGPYLAEVSLQ